MNGLRLKRMDWVMLGTILMLVGLSAAFIFSAQFKSDEAYGSDWIKQLAFAGMGLCVYFALTWYDYNNIARLAWFAYGGAIMLLLLVFAFPAIGGAHRWIPLPGLYPAGLRTRKDCGGDRPCCISGRAGPRYGRMENILYRRRDCGPSFPADCGRTGPEHFAHARADHAGHHALLRTAASGCC